MVALSEGHYLSVVEKDKKLEVLTREQQHAVAQLLISETRGLRGLLGDAQRELAMWIEFNKDLKGNLRKSCGVSPAQTEEY